MSEVEVTASTIDELRGAVARIGRHLEANANDLPTYGSSDQSGRPHIEVSGDTWSYVVCERGSEFERRETLDPKELLYWIFESVAHQLASDFELANRKPGRDSRRIVFDRQLALLASIDDSWAVRLSEHHRTVLEEHPFDDAASERAQRSKELRDSGLSEAEAWTSACSEYPLPNANDA